MTESKKIIHNFILCVVWTLFITLTLCGLITADERTKFNSTGKESPTVRYNTAIFPLDDFKEN